MANIQLDGLYDQKQREFGTRGSGLARYDSDFIDATNRAIGEINNDCDLESTISRIVSYDEEINLDDTHEECLSHGISKHLLSMGRRPPKGGELLLTNESEEFERGKVRIWSKIINDKQNADSDDEEYDIIGLGHLG